MGEARGRSEKEKIIMKDEKNYVYGKHPVIAKLTNNPKSVEKIFLKETLDAKVVAEVQALAKKARVPFSFIPQDKLDSMAEGGVHQGMVAQVLPIEFLDLSQWLKSVEDVQNPCVMLLDELEDPHNVGAIIRTAVAAGVHGIIVPKHRQAPLSGAAYKTSAGLMEQIPLIRVTNVNDAIRTLKDNKFWIVGLDQGAKETIWSQDLDMPVCFIVGAEGDGMRQKTGELCDFLIKIPMEPVAESLNASVSAAIVMYEWRRRRQ
jgi:23S rRNA (guanosine2251-2'-O)-methyltransferase